MGLASLVKARDGPGIIVFQRFNSINNKVVNRFVYCLNISSWLFSI